MFMAADWSQGGGCWRLGWLCQFLKMYNSFESCCIGCLFLSQKLSLWHAVLFGSILPTVKLFSKLESVLSTPVMLYRLCLCNTLNPLWLFQQYLQDCHQEDVSSQEISFFVHPQEATLRASNSWDRGISLTFSRSTSNSSLLAASTTSAVTFPWTLQSHPWRLESTSSRFLLMLLLWPPPVTLKCKSHREW